jgi:hypothetical protein
MAAGLAAMTGEPRCDLCSGPVNPAKRSTSVLVQGWLPRNMSGGGQVQLREVVPGHFAHDVCVHRRKLGIPDAQQSLGI